MDFDFFRVGFIYSVMFLSPGAASKEDTARMINGSGESNTDMKKGRMTSYCRRRKIFSGSIGHVYVQQV